MSEPKHPPDVEQQQREAIARRLVDLARPLLEEAEAILNDTDPTDKESGS